MSRDTALVLALGLVALVVVAALGGGLLGGSVTTQVHPNDQPDPTAEGVVYLVREEAHRTILWFEFGTQHSIGVSFLVAAGCAATLDGGDRWPVDEPSCASDVDVDVEGEVWLMGRQADGQGLVGVIFEVSRECFDAVAVGVAWPPVAAVCSGD